jgi:FkbH-like protein
MVAKIRESSTYDLWQELKAWLDVRELAEEDVLRVAQLSQKASQFSVLTNRYQEDEVRNWLTSKNERTFTVRAGDMFGEQGLVAFVRILFSNSLSNAEILDWTMSCRVAGRGLEERAWAEIERRLNKPCTIAAKWRRSQKNKPVENLFERLGFNVLSIDSAEKKYERVSR